MKKLTILFLIFLFLFFSSVYDNISTINVSSSNIKKNAFILKKTEQAFASSKKKKNFYIDSIKINFIYPKQADEILLSLQLRRSYCFEGENFFSMEKNDIFTFFNYEFNLTSVIDNLEDVQGEYGIYVFPNGTFDTTNTFSYYSKDRKGSITVIISKNDFPEDFIDTETLLSSKVCGREVYIFQYLYPSQNPRVFEARFRHKGLIIHILTQNITQFDLLTILRYMLSC